jgi:hypothetical protein
MTNHGCFTALEKDFGTDKQRNDGWALYSGDVSSSIERYRSTSRTILQGEAPQLSVYIYDGYILYGYI